MRGGVITVRSADALRRMRGSVITVRGADAARRMRGGVITVAEPKVMPGPASLADPRSRHYSPAQGDGIPP